MEANAGKVVNDEEANGEQRRGGRRGGRGGRGGRGRNRKRGTGTPSETGVFVANLPFSVTDAELKDIFKNYKVTSARVIVRSDTKRSKGFGFVEFETEDEQKRVVEEFSHHNEFEGRELVVRIAMMPEPRESPEGAATGEASAAAAQDSGAAHDTGAK